MCGAFTSDSRFIARPEALLGTISGKMIDASPLLIVVTSASFDRWSYTSGSIKGKTMIHAFLEIGPHLTL